MKHLLLSLLLLIFALSSAYSTEQVPDRLIIGNDTVYIKSFPLDDLHFKISPFKYYDGKYSFPNTACWRGYIATWKVIENKLILVEVVKADSTDEKLDILDYFEKNNYSPEIVNGFVFANWYSAEFVTYDLTFLHMDNNLYLYASYMPTEEEPRIVFENGMLTKDIIRNMDSFQIGDTLTKMVSYYRHWLLNDGVAKVQAVIMDKKQKMVKIDIVAYGTDKKRYVKRIRQEILGYREESNWVNPQYWK